MPLNCSHGVVIARTYARGIHCSSESAKVTLPARWRVITKGGISNYDDEDSKAINEAVLDSSTQKKPYPIDMNISDIRLRGL